MQAAGPWPAQQRPQLSGQLGVGRGVTCVLAPNMAGENPNTSPGVRLTVCHAAEPALGAVARTRATDARPRAKVTVPLRSRAAVALSGQTADVGYRLPGGLAAVVPIVPRVGPHRQRGLLSSSTDP